MTKEKEETKIAKIVLKVEGKEIALSAEGARELKNLLNGLFGETVKEVHHDHYYRDYWKPYWTTGIYGLQCKSEPTLSVQAYGSKTVVKSIGLR